MEDGIIDEAARDREVDGCSRHEEALTEVLRAVRRCEAGPGAPG